MKDETKGIVSLLISTLIYSFFGVLTRIIGFSIPVFYAMWVRAFVTIGILFLVAYYTHQWSHVKPKDWKWFILRSVGGMVGFLGSYVSFYFLPLGTALFIFYGGSTVGGYALGRLLIGERITRIKGISLVIALLGLLLIYITRIGTGSLLYMLLAFAGGLGTATWNVSSKKISGTYSDVQLNATDFLLNGMFALFASVLLQEQWVPIQANTVWLANLLFIILFISTGQLMVYGFKRLDAQIASLIMLTEVLFGVILGYLFYAEIPSAWSVVGGGMIIASIVLAEMYSKKARK